MTPRDDSKSIFQDFGKSLNVSALRVLSRPKPDIFLCGGSDGSKSIRCNFMNFAEQHWKDFYSRLVLAENVIKSWFRADSYDNLLELEEDLASVASVVPIFLESPGSFAEVGAFSSNQRLIKKVLVFQDMKYQDAESFLNLGPLHKIRKISHGKDVLCYPWDNISAYFEDIKDIILEKLNIKEKKFCKNNIGDVSILVIEILNLSRLAKKNDIECVLESASIHISRKQMNKIFYILKKMNCIEDVEAGRSKYLKSLCTNKMLHFAFSEASPTHDIYKWGFKISDYYSKIDRNWNILWETDFDSRYSQR